MDVNTSSSSSSSSATKHQHVATTQTAHTAFHEFPKLSTHMKSINYLGEEYFLDFLSNLQGEHGVIKQLNIFVEDILHINKQLPDNFITVRFIVSEYTFMRIFLQLLNFKRSECFTLPNDPFNNILMIFHKILDNIHSKINNFIGRMLPNDKEYDILQYIVILGQTFYKKPSLGVYDKNDLLMAKKLGMHEVFKDPRTWERLIDYYIKQEKKNLKRLKQNVTKERELTLTSTTFITYIFNMQNFGVDTKNIECVKAYAEKNGISSEVINCVNVG